MVIKYWKLTAILRICVARPRLTNLSLVGEIVVYSSNNFFKCGGDIKHLV